MFLLSGLSSKRIYKRHIGEWPFQVKQNHGLSLFFFKLSFDRDILQRNERRFVLLELSWIENRAEKVSFLKLALADTGLFNF